MKVVPTSGGSELTTIATAAIVAGLLATGAKMVHNVNPSLRKVKVRKAEVRVNTIKEIMLIEEMY